MVRNTASAKAKLAKALTLDFGTDDQKALAAAMWSKSGIKSTLPSVDDDVIRLESLAVRALVPRCMDAHPMNWSPWGRWLPGDFISHNWGANKEHFTLDACVAGSHADWRTRALVLWNLRRGFFAGMLCAAMIWMITAYVLQICKAASLISSEAEPLLKPVSKAAAEPSSSKLVPLSGNVP